MKKIKIILFFLICFLLASSLFAQIDIGNVNSLNEVVGQEVFMYSAHNDFNDYPQKSDENFAIS